MKTFFNRIFTRIKYDIKEIIMIIIMAVSLLLTVFYLDTQTDLPKWAVGAISFVVLLIFNYINFAVNWNIYNPFCTYEVEGKLVDYILIFEGWENTIVEKSYTQILVVEYEYKRRKYKKIIKVPNVKKRRIGSKIKLKVCKFCPRIIHIEKE